MTFRHSHAEYLKRVLASVQQLYVRDHLRAAVHQDIDYLLKTRLNCCLRMLAADIAAHAAPAALLPAGEPLCRREGTANSQPPYPRALAPAPDDPDKKAWDHDKHKKEIAKRSKHYLSQQILL